MNPKTNKSGFVTFFKGDAYFFQFNDEKGSPILYSRAYQSDKSRDNSIQSVIENVGKNYSFDVQPAGKDKFLFVLKAGNHQEIGRSRLFDSREEMEEKQQLLRDVGADVPIMTLEVAAEKQDEKKEEKRKEFPRKVLETPAESPQEIIQKVVEQTRKEDAAGQPLRYKFNVIYYPEADRWLVKMVNTDPEEKSDDFESYEGKRIGEFLKAHLPHEAVKAELSTTREPGPEPVTPVIPKAKGVSQQLPQEILQKVQEEIELTIRSFRGEEINVSTQVFNLGQVEISPKEKEGKTFSEQPYEVKVVAKSIKTSETVLLGEIKDKTPRYGRFVVPISNLNELKPGWYRLLATVRQGQPGEEQHDYHGSRMLMVN